ncbi:MAG: hypothetical protein RR216_02880, partial [Pseudoflavonifractor sp.]
IELVNQIIAAEHSAQSIAHEVKERERSLDKDLARENDEMRSAYFARAKRRIEAVEQAENAAAEADIAAWDTRLDAAMSKVESSFDRGRDQWVDTLVGMIVGGTL